LEFYIKLINNKRLLLEDKKNQKLNYGILIQIKQYKQIIKLIMVKTTLIDQLPIMIFGYIFLFKKNKCIQDLN